MLKRSATDGYRLQQQQEVEKIKEHLAKNEIACSVLNLQRGILMPEESDFIPGQRKYPSPLVGLMVNPFPKKKKKKKGKKRKKAKK